MKDVENIYETIKNRSDFILNEGHEWTKEISSAKNYITTPDFKHWTFGKSAGLNNTYHYNGGAAKKWLYSIGFINVFELPNSIFKSSVVKSFRNWASEVTAFDIVGKFNKDQANNKRFEILVHSDLVPKSLLNKIDFGSSNQLFFDEGFKKLIVRELSIRRRDVVSKAKAKHGTVCEVCGFDFTKVYGTHGLGFIEMHHLNPIKDGRRKTTIDDLRPVCPNCHRMLHKGNRLLSIDELRQIIDNQKTKGKSL